jgi:hypothetical protein
MRLGSPPVFATIHDGGEEKIVEVPVFTTIHDGGEEEIFEAGVQLFCCCLFQGFATMLSTVPSTA